MDKPDRINADLSSPDFHGHMWDVTLDGVPVKHCLAASREHRYLIRYQTDDDGIVPADLPTEVLYGDVDYDRIVNAEGLE